MSNRFSCEHVFFSATNAIYPRLEVIVAIQWNSLCKFPIAFNLAKTMSTAKEGIGITSHIIMQQLPLCFSRPVQSCAKTS